MCWIFAYNWSKNSVPFLVEWLRNLEYRWYDSAWILCVNKDREIYLEKSIWKVSNLATKIEKNIDFNIDFPNLPFKIIADKKLLMHVIYTLLMNAFKYTISGSISLSMKLVDESKHKLLITVSDTGAGMDAQEQSHLFQILPDASRPSSQSHRRQRRPRWRLPREWFPGRNRQRCPGGSHRSSQPSPFARGKGSVAVLWGCSA